MMRVGAVGAGLLLLLLSHTPECAVADETSLVRVSSKPGDSALKPGQLSEELSRLELCDCEPATGAPYNLSCEREGFFISDFEREGQWLAGGGLVPLSRAICCRPCLPKDLPPDSQLLLSNGNITALAIVSIGCHKSTGRGGQHLSCDTGGALAVGYAEANRVSAVLDAYYPVGQPECCTPAVLLSNGDALELQQCNCQPSDSINCGGQQTHRLLAGYQHWRMTFATQYVPVGPAYCCSACLSQQIHRADTCADKNGCSGHGVCIMGQCECLDGWHGAACSDRSSSGGAHALPNWLIGLIVAIACFFATIMLALVARALKHYDLLPHYDDASEEGDDAHEPLLAQRLADDEAGSVGSQDTTDCDSDTEAAIAAVSSANNLVAEAQERAADSSDQLRLESVETLVMNAVRQYPNNVDAGIEHAMREMGSLISDAEEGDAAAVAEAMRLVEAPLAESVRAAYREQATRRPHARAQPADPAAQGDVAAVLQQQQAAAAQDAASPAAAPAAMTAAATQTAAPPPARHAAHRQPLHEPPDDTAIEIEAASEASGSGDEAASQYADDELAAEEAVGKAERKAKLVAAGRQQELASGPLASLDCSVCLSRPIQVVVIPCGHACMCRRCSRRLNRCPICRKDVVRRQRLFVGG